MRRYSPLTIIVVCAIAAALAAAAEAQSPAAPAPATGAPAKAATPAAISAPATTPAGLPDGVDCRKGVIHGRVLDISGAPVGGATVALQDSSGKVMTWTTTDKQGEYALVADPMTALALRPSRGRGLLEQCARAVGDVVMAPVKVVANAVANPGETVKAVAVSVGTGTPVPLAAQAVAPVIGDKNAAKETARSARDTAVRTAAGEGPKPAKSKAEKGCALIMVSAPSYKQACSKANAFWMEAPEENGPRPVGLQAWLETVELAPTNGDKKSLVLPQTLTLTDPIVQPTLAPAGSVVSIQVKMQSPPEPDHKVRVFAREMRKDTVVELAQQNADKTVYAGKLTLDPKLPAGDTIISIAALRADPLEVKLDPKKPDPLVPFASKLDDLEGNKPYQFDPRIMASENRIDVKLTILDASKGTPPPQPAH